MLHIKKEHANDHKLIKNEGGEGEAMHSMPLGAVDREDPLVAAQQAFRHAVHVLKLLPHDVGEGKIERHLDPAASQAFSEGLEDFELIP